MKAKEIEERLLKLEQLVKNNSISADLPLEQIKEETAPPKPKTKRPPSAYNMYVKNELAKLKEQPGFDRKEAFKTIAKNWKASKESSSEKKSGGDGWFS